MNDAPRKYTAHDAAARFPGYMANPPRARELHGSTRVIPFVEVREFLRELRGQIPVLDEDVRAPKTVDEYTVESRNGYLTAWRTQPDGTRAYLKVEEVDPATGFIRVTERD
jgi:hypothetical protein